MTSRRPFVLRTTPLEAGTTLIEASAGTGKTFTISRVFLRLILERDLSVREILVVTYTEAATEELRDRIRRTLLDAAEYLRTGRRRQADLAELLAVHRASGPAMLRRLERALNGFDEAHIFTIHGFCLRTLQDRAFESGNLFDVGLLTDETELMQEVADDYWRSTFYEAHPVLVAFALNRNLEPGALLHWLRSFRRHPGLKILSRVAGRQLADLAGELVQHFSQASRIWLQDREQIRAILAAGKPWAKREHAKADVMQDHLARVEDAFRADRLSAASIEGLRFLTSERLQANTKVRQQPPAHPFFAACTDVERAGEDFLTGLRIDFLERAAHEQRERKRRRKLQSFDDLLVQLQEALRGPAGVTLTRQVRQRYSAALIDEFQDTDPVQCEIFSRLFQDDTRRAPDEGGSSQSVAPQPFLFLIGDPKQAIYSFRGADIFTYRDAAGRITQGYTLGQNWRSESPLVRAVNTVFACAQTPFVFDFIPFQPVVAAGDADQEPLREAGRQLPPLQIWFMPRPPGRKAVTKEQADQVLPAVVAGEIARLLRGGTTLGEQPVDPRDMAVLVPENRQARLMQEALRVLNIPSVLHTEESVFGSLEAQELACVLAALATPGQERLLRAAWVTDLLGFGASQLENQAGQAGAWQELTERAYQHRDRWQREGFSSMFRAWLQGERVRARLLQFADGERRLTNLLHLGEVLHQAAHHRQLGPAGLVRWLQDQIAIEEHSEEHQLRLERDDEAVRLVTIHKSKGLEYPIVFCPFSWSTSESRRDEKGQAVCHREVGTAGELRSELIWDLGSPDLQEHRARAFQEKLAENLRLLYVALTRARHRCYFVWGGFNRASSAAAAWLFHRPPVLTDPLQQCLDQHFKGLDDAAIRRDLADLVEASKDPNGYPSIQLSDLPPASTERYVAPVDVGATLAPRRFEQHIARDWRITSFSTLTAPLEDARPDYDRVSFSQAVGEAQEPLATGIFAFPRGSGPGTCLHKILETIDFTNLNQTTRAGESLEGVVGKQLRTWGLSATDWTQVVSDAVRRAVGVPLQPEQGGPRLAEVDRDHRLSELEFQFPAARLTPELVRQGLGEVAAAPEFEKQLERLEFQPVRGFLKGFIDLVFESGGRYYLLDWKSNWLGNQLEDYSPSRLQTAMAQNFYVLQYYLYTVALHQYLSRRLPGYDYDRHFGGAYYLFLRGLNPDRPEFGVFRDRPPPQKIETLAQVLVATPEP